MRIEFTEVQSLLEVLEELQTELNTNKCLEWENEKINWAVALVKEWCE